MSGQLRCGVNDRILTTMFRALATSGLPGSDRRLQATQRMALNAVPDMFRDQEERNVRVLLSSLSCSRRDLISMLCTDMVTVG